LLALHVALKHFWGSIKTVSHLAFICQDQIPPVSKKGGFSVCRASSLLAAVTGCAGTSRCPAAPMPTSNAVACVGSCSWESNTKFYESTTDCLSIRPEIWRVTTL